MPTGVFADDDRPLADDVEKQLNVAFAMMKAAHCCFVVGRPLANLLMLTADDKCPLADEDAHWLLR